MAEFAASQAVSATAAVIAMVAMPETSRPPQRPGRNQESECSPQASSSRTMAMAVMIAETMVRSAGR